MGYQDHLRTIATDLPRSVNVWEMVSWEDAAKNRTKTTEIQSQGQCWSCGWAA
jgi:hypothetical protein